MIGFSKHNTNLKHKLSSSKLLQGQRAMGISSELNSGMGYVYGWNGM